MTNKKNIFLDAFRTQKQTNYIFVQARFEMRGEFNLIVGDSGSRSEYIMNMFTDELRIIIVETKVGRKRRRIWMMLEDSLLDSEGYIGWLALIGSCGAGLA